MKLTKKTAIVVSAIAMIALTFLLYPSGVAHSDIEITDVPKPTLTHAQMVWKYALEWCESNGRKEAINPNDLDNTPSYGSYQFKPSTLKYYGTIYGVKNATTTDVMDYETQSAVVEQMILHRDEINWNQQFPWCVKKLGAPPKP